METPQINTPEAVEHKTDDEILAEAAETARQVGAVAERAVYVLDKSGVVATQHEVEDALARRHEGIK